LICKGAMRPPSTKPLPRPGAADGALKNGINARARLLHHCPGH
jgi:hypothetical protein